MAPDVRYLGPADEFSPVTRYRARRSNGEVVVLARDEVVEGVPRELCDRLRDDDEHRFAIGRDAGKAKAAGEPWSGYDAATAEEIVERLGDASADLGAEVAAYEEAHDKRKTVLEAAEAAQPARTQGP